MRGIIDLNEWGTQHKREIDFAALNQHGLSNLQTVLEHFLPGGKIVCGEYQCGGVNGGQGSSCSTNMDCIGREFAGSERGWNDPVSLVAAVRNKSQKEAALELAAFLCIDAYKPGPAPERKTISKPDPEEKVSAMRRIWSQSVPCSEHPYTTRKGVPVHPDLRCFQDDYLIVPLKDEYGVLQSIERIWPDGTKKTLAPKSGAFFTFEADYSTIYIAEGYATAAAVSMATGGTTIMASDAGNMVKVAKIIAAKYPQSEIVIAADNDPKENGSNPGIEAAQKAIAEMGRGRIIAPPGSVKTDWNDVLVVSGVDALKTAFGHAEDRALFVSAMDQVAGDLKIDFLVKGVLEYGTTNAIIGPSGCGKSFVSIDLCAHVATGKDWNGHKIVRQGAVLYLAGEGRGGVGRRLRAWCQHYKVDPSDLKDLYVSRNTLVMDGTFIEDICREMAGKDVVLIVIDTLNRHLDGDENSTADMSEFIRQVDGLRERLGATEVIVHHTGLSDATRSRGSSALKGALDSEILCNRGTLEWTKTKDMEAPPIMEFQLHQVEIGVDEDGAKVTSCVPIFGQRAEKYDDMTDVEQKAIDTLVKASAKRGGHNSKNEWGAREDDWRDEFLSSRKKEKAKMGEDEKSDTARKAFYRVRDGLSRRGLVFEDKNLMIPRRKDHQDDIVTRMMLDF